MSIAPTLVVAGLLATATWLVLDPVRPAGQRLSRARRHQRPEQGPRLARADDVLLDVSVAAELLAVTLRAGGGVIEAVEEVSRVLPGSLGADLRTVAAARRWGLPDEESWSAIPTRWAPIARALRLADTGGIAPARLLLDAAEDLRRAEAHRIDVATAELGVRLVLPLGLAFLPAFALLTIVPVVLALTTGVLRL